MQWTTGAYVYVYLYKCIVRITRRVGVGVLFAVLLLHWSTSMASTRYYVYIAGRKRVLMSESI